MIQLHPDGSAEIDLAGEIDVASVAGIDDQVDSALAGDPTSLTLVMRDVEFIDSSGIGALVRARRACLGRSIPFFLADPSPVVTRMLQLTALEQVMQVRPPTER